MTAPNLGWHRRGYLPHYDQAREIQFVSFRLHDAVPAEVVRRWKQELHWNERLRTLDPRSVKLREKINRYEDKGYGDCWLRRPEIAKMVENALLVFDEERYRIYAWCVMPNHVHMLLEPFAGFPMPQIMRSLKGYTAREANRLLSRSGRFWMRDYHDRLIRDEDHFHNAVRYVERNPVRAGLVRRPQDWVHSSARVRLAKLESV